MEAVDLLPKGANSRIAAAAVGLAVAIMRNWTREKSGSIVLMNRFTRARARGLHDHGSHRRLRLCRPE